MLARGPGVWGSGVGNGLVGAAPETYCVPHECSLQNMPEPLVGVTAQGIQVEPAMKQRKASWILEDEMMVKHSEDERMGRCDVTKAPGWPPEASSPWHVEGQEEL